MIFLAFLLASPLGALDPTIVSEFGKTCVASRTKAALTSALSTEGWKAYATMAQSHLEHEIAAVSPMLEAQGLASDYTIYSFDGGGRHLELALSETKKPMSGSRKLIGCSIYGAPRWLARRLYIPQPRRSHRPWCTAYPRRAYLSCWPDFSLARIFAAVPSGPLPDRFAAGRNGEGGGALRPRVRERPTKGVGAGSRLAAARQLWSNFLCSC
jgi:hypothetical protein